MAKFEGIPEETAASIWQNAGGSSKFISSACKFLPDYVALRHEGSYSSQPLSCVGCYAMQTGGYLPTFRVSLLPPPWGSCSMECLTLTQTLDSSAMSVNNHRQTWRNTQHDLNLQHRCEEFKYRRCDTYASATRLPTSSFPDALSLYSMVYLTTSLSSKFLPTLTC
jgi:hypothetical protein